MVDNHFIILNRILSEKRSTYPSTLIDSDYFCMFSYDNLLKNFELTYDDLFDGDIGNGGDGGIDGFFTFINNELLTDDIDLGNFKKPEFDIKLFQAKRSDSFEANEVQKITATIKNIFDFSKNAREHGLYNDDLIDKIELFKSAFQTLITLHPKLKVELIYVTKGNTASISYDVRIQAEKFNQTLPLMISNSETKTIFVGSKELIDAYNKQKEYTLELNFQENNISKGDSNYIVLCNLYDYYKFVTDSDGNLRNIFESNVRDYEGNVDVNKDILYTLKNPGTLDFWCLNNGITILTTQVGLVPRKLVVDNCQIVNGLQTTLEIVHYFSELSQRDRENECRSLLIKVLKTDDPETRDKIIKATNFQTAIPSYSFRATDRVQRDIESYFLSCDLFYDRRKNYYKNLGKPSGKIITIPLLAQTVMAILRRKPNISRASPSSLIKNDDLYKKIFNPNIPLILYHICTKLIKKIERIIRAEFPSNTLRERKYLKFHISLALVVKFFETRSFSIDQICSINVDDLSDELMRQTVTEVIDIAHSYMDTNSIDIVKLSKNPEFVSHLLDNIQIS